VGRAGAGVQPVRISAATGEGIDTLLATIEARLPESPVLLSGRRPGDAAGAFLRGGADPRDDLRDVRQEVPYATLARVEEFREAEQPVFIRATVYVERESQKPIIIGRKGAGIRELGRRSREKIEAFLGQSVYLDLWVKALPNWRSRAETLKYLGYRLPASMAGEAAGGGTARGGSAKDRGKNRGD
jgi:GTPase